MSRSISFPFLAASLAACLLLLTACAEKQSQPLPTSQPADTSVTKPEGRKKSNDTTRAYYSCVYSCMDQKYSREVCEGKCKYLLE